jgi:serine/threonine protein kinase
VFSAGVVLYELLSGVTPFYGSDVKTIMERNMLAEVEFPEKHWSGISPEAIDLIHKMLDPNPHTRISAFDALYHPWFIRHQTVPQPMFIEPTIRQPNGPIIKAQLISYVNGQELAEKAN